MNIEQIIEQLSNPNPEGFPREALAAAKTVWTEFLPVIDRLTARYYKGDLLSDEEDTLLFYGVLLQADQAEHSRFESLVALCQQHDDEQEESFWGDSVTEDLPSILYILANGRYQPLLELIVDPVPGEFIRLAVANTLFAMLEQGQIEKETLSQEVSKWLLLFKEKDYRVLLTQVAELLVLFDFAEFKIALSNLSKEDCFDAFNPEVHKVIDAWHCPEYCQKPFHSGYVKSAFDINSIAGWAWFKLRPPINALADDYVDDANFPLFDDSGFEFHEPYIRQEAKVGRNDPCPCGSGKKYKKCCLP